MSVIKLEQVRFTGQPRSPGPAEAPAGAAVPGIVKDAGKSPGEAAVAAGDPAARIAELTSEVNALRAELQARRTGAEQQQRSAAEALERERARLQAEAAAAVKQARAEGHAAGIAEGREQVARDETRQLEALRTAAARAADGAAASAAQIESLALGIARLALRAVLDDEAWRAEALAAAVRHHVQRLAPAGGAALRVLLPAADVALCEALRTGLPQAEVSIDPALAAGACLVELQGRSADLGWAHQLARLDELLAAMASHG